MENNKFSSEVVEEKIQRQMIPPVVIDEEDTQSSHSTSHIKSRRDRYAKKNFSSTPVQNFRKFGKGSNAQEGNPPGMGMNFPPGFVPAPPGFIGMGKPPDFHNKGINYQMPQGFVNLDAQNMMPSISQQLNNLNLSNQNLLLQSQLASGGMLNLGGISQSLNQEGLTQDQIKLLLALQGQSNIQAAPPPQPKMRYGSTEFSGIGVPQMHEKLLPTQAQPAYQAPASTAGMSMSDLTKTFISSMKDLSGKGKTTGILKFFNEGKGFGFFVSDADGKDVFFHYEDVKDLKITKDFLREAKNKFIVKFAFTVQVYYGKYNYSTKAVDIELLGIVDLKFLSSSDSSLAS
uniref:CSD domain-containing protein n=1 Tax=Euplotes crassus TaxID=5936 RepID=A0A7S3KX84_EUPCR|mmetsp:Transcript_9524/g.9295  ORF Transcript_9524/g.9295 Transcript_9524/m.9295 type:complete len:345 (+) Transcript_9524:355-1389(+)